MRRVKVCMLYNWTAVNETCQGVYVIQLDSSMIRVKVCMLYNWTAVNDTCQGVSVIQWDSGQ